MSHLALHLAMPGYRLSELPILARAIATLVLSSKRHFLGRLVVVIRAVIGVGEVDDDHGGRFAEASKALAGIDQWRFCGVDFFNTV